MKNIADIDKEMNSGIVPSLNFNDVPMWADGANVGFMRDSVAPLMPHRAVFQKLEASPIRGMLEGVIGGEKHIFFGTQTKLYRWTPSLGLVDVTRGGVAPPYSGIINATPTQVATSWSLAQWGEWVIASNGVDEPQIYKPNVGVFGNLDTQNSLGFTFSTAEIMLPFKDFMFALNTVNSHASPQSGGTDFAHFSEPDNPEKWNPTIATNVYAGDLPIRDAEGPIRAALVLSQGLVLFTDHSMHVITFVGAPNFFGQTHVLNECGVVSKQAICSENKVLYGFSQSGPWRTDGASVQKFAEPAILRYILDDLNFEQSSKILVWNNLFEHMIEFHYPTKDSLEVNRAVGFNYIYNNWTLIDRARTSATRTSVFAHGITASALGDVLFQMTGDFSDAGATGFEGRGPRFGPETVTGGTGYGMGGYGMGGYGGSFTEI